MWYFIYECSRSIERVARPILNSTRSRQTENHHIVGVAHIDSYFPHSHDCLWRIRTHMRLTHASSSCVSKNVTLNTHSPSTAADRCHLNQSLSLPLCAYSVHAFNYTIFSHTPNIDRETDDGNHSLVVASYFLTQKTLIRDSHFSTERQN